MITVNKSLRVKYNVLINSSESLIFNHVHIAPLFSSLDPMKNTQCIISHDAYSPLSGSRWLARVTRYPVFAQNMGGELPEGNQTT